MKEKIRRQLDRCKRQIHARLEPFQGGTDPRVLDQPEITAPRPTYELAERARAISCGGLPAVLQLVHRLGLPQRIDAGLGILKVARPYQDSDHVLNIALNVLCDGHVLDDIEIRRNDSAFLDAIGARAIPDPTTAGDFCRRFLEQDIWHLMNIINEVRLSVWQHSSRALTHETARIDVDGSIVPTTGECKEGMDLSFKGEWGYHPLLVTLANTAEPLYVVNRSGNRPSHEGAPAVLDQAIELCRRAGFKDVLMRGDTDFSMTAHLDRWDAAGVRFVFGFDANRHFIDRAESLDSEDYEQLIRKANAVFATQENCRTRQPRIKEEIIRERGYLNKRLLREDTAEFEHRPSRAKETYRIVVLRKLISEERGQLTLGTKFHYFFYITNDRKLTQAEVVAESNARCEQEKIFSELKTGIRALHAPLNTLNANWAYTVMSALAWTFKAWFALQLPASPRWRERHQAAQSRVLRMGFRSFLQDFILIPAQVIAHGRQLIVRLLSWRPELPVLFRLLDAL